MPDADIIIRIVEIFEVSVCEILGAKLDSGNDINAVAEQLSRINEQPAIKNRRSHCIWKTVAILIGAIIALNIILVIIGMVSFDNLKVNKQTTITTETEIIDKE